MIQQLVTPPPGALVLSTTKFQEAARCLKLYEYHAIDKIVPTPKNISTSMRRGIWVHSGRDAEAQGLPWTHRLSELYQWAYDAGIEESQRVQVYEESHEILQGYFNYWSQRGQVIKPIASEQELYAQLTPTLWISATLDAIWPNNNHLWVVEYKTTEHIPPANWRCVDPQTAMQFVVARVNKIPVDGILFDYLLSSHPPVPQVLKDGSGFYAKEIQTTTRAFNEGAFELAGRWADKTSTGLAMLKNYMDLKRREMINDEKFYQRYEMHRPEKFILESMKDLKAIAEMIELAMKNGYFPRSFHPVLCTRMCMYRDLCSIEYMSGRKSDAIRQADFMIDDGRREGRFPVLQLEEYP